MKKLVVFLLIAFTTVVHVYASSNIVINQALREASIDNTKYIIGIGSKPATQPYALKNAREEAIANIYKQVSGIMRNIILATKYSAGNQNVAEYYNSVAQKPTVFSELHLIDDVDLPIPDYRDKYDNVYAVVAVSREDLKQHYTTKADELRKKIEDNLSNVRIGDPKEIEINLKSYADYETLKEMELIELGSEHNPNPEATFEKLQEYFKEKMSEYPQKYINETVNDYYTDNYPVNSPADIADIIAAQFVVQGANTSGVHVQLDRFTYGITDVTTVFSNSLHNALNVKLSTMWPIVLGTGTGAMGLQPMAKLRLTGTFWEMGADKVTIRAALRDVENGEFQAAAILTFKKKDLQTIVHNAYKPTGYSSMLATLVSDAQDFFVNNTYASTTTPSTGTGKTPSTPSSTTPVITEEQVIPLKVRVRTGKGEEPQVVKVGEKLNIYVQTNQPAHLRLVSVLPGNKWTLLAKDMFIDSDNINQWVLVPGNFVVAPPIGLEQYRVMARIEKDGRFPEITQFYNEGGYRYIGKRPPISATQQELLAHVKGQVRRTKGTRNLNLSSSPKQDTKGTVNTKLTPSSDNTVEVTAQQTTSENLAVVTATLFVETVEE